MPFDLENSEKIEDVAPPQPAFDLENSEVIDSDVPWQHTYRESTNKVVAAPIGLTSEEIEYFDDAQSSDFLRGVRIGIEGMPQMMGATLDAAGYASGIKKGGDLPVIRRPADPISRTRPRFGGFAEAFKQGKGALGKASNIINQIEETAGQTVAPMLPSLALGAAGGGAGAAVGGPIGGVVGTAAGAFAGSETQIPGEFFLALEDAAAEFNEQNKDNPLTYNDIASSALLYGSPAAILDALPTGKVAHGVGKKLTEEAIQASAREIVKRIAIKTGKVSLEEGATEAAQEAAKVAAVSEAVDKPILTPSNVAQVLEAGAAGVVGGGLLGGAASTVEEGVNAARVTPPEIPPATVTTEEAAPAPITIDHSLHIPEDFREFAKTYEATTEGLQKAARDFVMKGQADTGNEHLLAIDKNGKVTHVALGERNKVHVPDDVVRAMTAKGADIEFVHSHPDPVGLSPDDLIAFARSGVKSNTAITPDGHYSKAYLSPETRSSLDDMPLEQRRKVLRDITKFAWDVSQQAVVDRSRNGIKEFKDEQELTKYRQVHNYVFNKALERAGLINYEYSDNHFDVVPEDVMDQAINDTVGIIKEGMALHGIKGRDRSGRLLDTPISGAREQVRDIDQTAADTKGMESGPREGGNGNQGPPPISGGIASEPDREGDYQRVATERPPRQKSAAGIVVNDISNLAADAFVPVSTRLGKIDESLKHTVRRFVYETSLHTHEDNTVAKPFIEVVSNKLSEGDYRILDLALKNADMDKVNEVMAKYGLTSEWQAVQGLLTKIHAEAKESGMDIGFVENYFPRKVRKDMVPEYLAFLKGQEEWSLIETEMAKEDPDGTMTDEEKAEFANKWLRGYKNSRLQLARPGHAKTRSIDYIDPDMNRFYEDSMPTLINYISGMRHGIESRKLFGMSEKETDDNIGAYVLNLIDAGIVKPEQEQLLRRILKAVVEPTGTRGAVTWAKDAAYVYTMGSPISALTQLQDMAFSLHKNGYYQTAKSFLKSTVGNVDVTPADLGIHNVLQEFSDSTKANTIVRRLFNSIGLTFMDNLGKQTYIDAAAARLRKAAKKNTPEFQERMVSIFGNEAEQVTQDLKNGVVTENTKYLLFSELSDVQPISLAEMPIGYLRGGNGRVFYMLKTYTVKQLDLYRREIFDNLGRTSLKANAKGMKNLVSLASALMLMGMGTDALKDLLLGRDIDIDDLVMDNILKTTGFTKYQIYQTKRDGVMNTFWKTLFVPPIGAPLDDLGKDVAALYSGEKGPEDLEIWQHVPFAGKFYYWWFGAGAAKG